MIDSLENRTAILEIGKRHGANNMRLFGSAARGEMGPDSDIDFLVELEKGRSLVDQAALMLDLKELLGRKIDIVEPSGLHRYIKDSIISEATPL